MTDTDSTYLTEAERRIASGWRIHCHYAGCFIWAVYVSKGCRHSYFYDRTKALAYYLERTSQ
jgi:hypothetical protein